MTRGPAGFDLLQHVLGAGLADRLPGRMRVARYRLRYQRGSGRMDGQVQPADHGPDRDVEDLFGDSQDLLDPRMAVAADQDQAGATDIDQQRLFGDVAKPEQHPRQRRQHGHAGPDHPRVGGGRDIGARVALMLTAWPPFRFSISAMTCWGTQKNPGRLTPTMGA